MSEDLRDRFRDKVPEDGSDSANDTDHSDETDGAISTSDVDGAKDADDTVRERKQEAMYLRPTQREELREFYEELDARSKLAGDGALAKNDDFYEAFVSFVIDEHPDEFKEYVGLDDVE